MTNRNEYQQRETQKRHTDNVNVFRIKPVRPDPHPKLSPVAVALPVKSSVYHARRAHRKSREGCGNCKRRRVKCDESKPHCQRCYKHGIPCDYSTTTPSGESGGNETLSVSSKLPLDNFAHESTLRSLEEAIDRTAQVKVKADKPASAELLNLFVRSSTTTSPNKAVQRVMTTSVIQTAFSSPYLMHTILGISCLQLGRCSPANRDIRVLESYHWQQAIHLYQSAISSKITQKDVDALLSTCMLMGVSTLCPEDFEPEDAWVLSSNPAAMNWLCLQGGLRCLISLTQPFISKSIWAGVFSEADQKMRQVEGANTSLHPRLAELCNLDTCSTEKGITTTPTTEDSLYLHPLQMLTPLLDGNNTRSDFGLLQSFMARLEPEFLTLLRAKDHAAMLILAQWMGLMCAHAAWQPWIYGRISKECFAICTYLEQNTTDPRILELLEAPAVACGYRNGAPIGYTDR
ncbi:hypothetical protein ASPZODRAFT_58322 [Penicilliopsis zonata CBS 506.65]|uniref:Zn(2)-C6 fungal-type domain-containing protein n=1 Tax=Penicilliopsis zonata CBS 506.65 TaxID=1073090 RepID=A0A1L9ST00_9EURO|nr:hypothetical protein ASPZODRAFT_58322 [Penicilliopsis zonata CBS 506.65]OJJ50214.1 hypothetical protein ASPZODRAFT_58322 [Penicilliopsis zonata CBS 506.65]